MHKQHTLDSFANYDGHSKQLLLITNWTQLQHVHPIGYASTALTQSILIALQSLQFSITKLYSGQSLMLQCGLTERVHKLINIKQTPFSPTTVYLKHVQEEQRLIYLLCNKRNHISPTQCV